MLLGKLRGDWKQRILRFPGQLSREGVSPVPQYSIPHEPIERKWRHAHSGSSMQGGKPFFPVERRSATMFREPLRVPFVIRSRHVNRIFGSQDREDEVHFALLGIEKVEFVEYLVAPTVRRRKAEICRVDPPLRIRPFQPLFAITGVIT